ncbi:MAG TPA: YggS family pyridoxal phosphate-dependent enzyme [Gammaproteobacteria bacterium]|nr:YggS family pyridoxal phosphate-dependent enzyme [Gammaproteobacteria bacterium]
MHHTDIVANLQHIQENIAQLSQKYRRNPASIQLLAVSKTKPAEFIRAAFDAGQTRFGENYLQEALSKMQSLKDLPIEWHFIGAIQSRKTRELAEHFDWVHSVDRLKIAQRLNEQRPATLTPLNICLQINISEETSKSGLNINEVESIVDQIAPLPNLCLRGLMAIPARENTLNKQREAFSRMRLILQTLQNRHPDLDTLSMGMSADMEAAIAEGSTLLRIGTAIFGARQPTRV